MRFFPREPIKWRSSVSIPASITISACLARGWLDLCGLAARGDDESGRYRGLLEYPGAGRWGWRDEFIPAPFFVFGLIARGVIGICRRGSFGPAAVSHGICKNCVDHLRAYSRASGFGGRGR